MFSIQNNAPQIIATLGPSTEHKDVVKAMVTAHLGVARFNFSHGDYETQKRRLEIVKEVSTEEHHPIMSFADLSGPKVRVGKIEGGMCELTKGTTFVLTTEELLGTKEKVSVTYADFIHGLALGISILLDDGKIELQIADLTQTEVHTLVVRGGTLLEEKGVNVPEATWEISSLTEKDKKDLAFIMNNPYDAVALSFVRSASNIEEARALMQTLAGRALPIISKLETRQAMHNLEEIIKSSDCVMVARGDLGVEIGVEHVPMQQKKICELAKTYNKPVIVATQLLESMVESPTPTRAEVSDVVNAILDGASYVMLSDETTTGKHPVECVEMLHTIITTYKTPV